MAGRSVADLTEGTIVANMGYDKVNHPNPVFHGDTVVQLDRSVLCLKRSAL